MEEAWDRYASAHPRGTLYHLVRWRNLVTRIFGQSHCYLYAQTDEDEISGILPIVRLKSRLFGDFMVSIPYVNQGGAIGDSRAVEQALMVRACEIASSLGLGHIEFRDTEPRNICWTCRTDKVAMIRHLPNNAEELWDDLGSKVRAQVKRPRKEGAIIVEGGRELISEFYRVFACNMRDLGTPVYPQTFFEAIAEA